MRELAMRIRPDPGSSTGATRMRGAARAAFARGWGRGARIAGLCLAGGAILALTLVSEPRTGLGRLLLGLGLPRLALSVLDDPDWRAAAFYGAGRYDAASAIYRDQGKRGRYNLGNALARSGDLTGALSAYDEALAYNPRDADAQANRSVVAKLLEEAIDRGKGGGIANAAALQGARFGNTQNQEKSDDVKATSSGEGIAGNKDAGSSESLPGNSPVARRGRSEQQAMDSGKGQARGAASDAAGRGRQGAGSAMVAAAPEREARRVTKSFEAHEIHADELWLQTLPDEPGRYLKLRLKAEQARRIEAGTAIPGGSNPW